ncbi:MAG: phosphoenolpyruvate carboxykinase (ATP) [Nanoarchaeota archaeon]|nr:phosphoenolpyruvate carboxykinase (ATP) [Nanoarchaeota archaeon]
MKISEMLNEHKGIISNPTRKDMIILSVKNNEAFPSKCGALATWTSKESTGRSPKDTYIVKRKESEETIDWDSPNNIPLDPETFELIKKDALTSLKNKSTIYVLDRVVGADVSYALPVKTISDKALHVLFIDNMFRPVPEDIEKSVLYNKAFTLISLPYDKLDSSRYEGRLRKTAEGKTSNMAVVIDLDHNIGIVYGSAYCGSTKKLMFSVMNYMLPEAGILPLHCSANEGKDKTTALFLGLSGTGKTTLSADPDRALLGDDEHGWNQNGIANFENGCYAKLINLKKEKEPEIFNAVFHEDDYTNHGAIIENTMMFPDGTFDLFDDRLTPNSRASYPLSYLKNIKEPPVGTHPNTIVFLTADANGVLPPVSNLSTKQAMLWFLMGYTSKLAGTETGIVDPVTVFSRFFGEPFMPRNPDVYANLFGEYIKKYDSKVFLINTGWTGGPFGEGKRIDIDLTRAMISAALNGTLQDVGYHTDTLFHLEIPDSCPDVPAFMLEPKNTWHNPDKYEKRAKKLAQDFSNHFDKVYAAKVPELAEVCPGK